MKWIIIFAIFIITLVTIPSMVFAQPTMGTQSAVSSDGHTVREEVEGKAIWEKLQAKRLECKNLTDDNFEVLGEYFMGQMAGSSHGIMNNMMQSMMGKNGEEQMHTMLGKKFSGCEPNALTSRNTMDNGMMSMMMGMMGGGMMGSAGSPQVGGGTSSMMGFGNAMGWSGFGFFGFLIWIFWTAVLVDLILLGIWLLKKVKKGSS